MWSVVVLSAVVLAVIVLADVFSGVFESRSTRATRRCCLSCATPTLSPSTASLSCGTRRAPSLPSCSPSRCAAPSPRNCEAGDRCHSRTCVGMARALRVSWSTCARKHRRWPTGTGSQATCCLPPPMEVCVCVCVCVCVRFPLLPHVAHPPSCTQVLQADFGVVCKTQMLLPKTVGARGTIN